MRPYDAAVRLLKLPRSERRAVAGAIAALCVGSTMRRVLPGRLVHRALSVSPRGVHRAGAPSAERLAALVEVTARRLPFSTSCLDRAVAARWILCRYGYRPAFVIGTAVTPPFAPHAWLDLSGAPADTSSHRVLWYSK